MTCGNQLECALQAVPHFPNVNDYSNAFQLAIEFVDTYRALAPPPSTQLKPPMQLPGVQLNSPLNSPLPAMQRRRMSLEEQTAVDNVELPFSFPFLRPLTFCV